MSEPEQPETEVAAEPEDLKTKFREALARKQAQAKSGEGHASGGSKVHDSHGKVGGKRQFRRKSG
ncbi:DUF5302 domain-containing protein [Actinokineospora sp. NBRC 105648]|uniref:DUF5302 domain-containing protein n=1 Tax=Actinokineospora sp. NBRC 105648 TaxID=3032206 RepID=UPI0024A4D73A|nr:DUF5302 domain-containing protein [Actinokineospora sp. NBRC 105648]GLZ42434.1 hypothetical protein Acsp05_60580 [Actinokineospora sp. NBRC 105648]